MIRARRAAGRRARTLSARCCFRNDFVVDHAITVVVDSVACRVVRSRLPDLARVEGHSVDASNLANCSARPHSAHGGRWHIPVVRHPIAVLIDTVAGVVRGFAAEAEILLSVAVRVPEAVERTSGTTEELVGESRQLLTLVVGICAAATLVTWQQTASALDAD